MSNSSLVSYTRISPNSSPRTAPISKITIHHAAVVNATLEGLGNGFANPNREASSNYGIDSQGRIGMYVEENRRAWTSSNRNNDNVAVTIEVANSAGAPNWEVSDKAYAALLDLCEDICRRNGIKKLIFTGDATGNLTQHNYFTATACPGPYLKSRFQDIADEVNRRLNKNGATTNNNNATGGKTVNIELNILRRNMTGPQVKTLQRLLMALGYEMKSGKTTYKDDGSFGPATETAVKQFQQKNGLEQDGIVGPATWNALLK